MKKNITKKFSKATIFLTIFVALTMVFTIYQTSINPKVNDLLGENSLEMLNVVDNALAANWHNPSVTKAGTYTCMDGSANYWIGPFGTEGGDPGTSAKTGSVSFSEDLARAAHGGVISYYAYCKILQNGNGETQHWTVGSSAISSSSCTTLSGSTITLPGGTTSLSWTLDLNTKWRAASTQESKIEYAQIVVISSDNSAPTISGIPSDGIVDDVKHDQSGESVTVTDSGAGLKSVSYDFTDITGKSKTVSHFTASGTGSNSHKTTTTINFAEGYGQYVISATDNLGKAMDTQTVYYYGGRVKASPIGEGQVTVNSGTFSSKDVVVDNIYTAPANYSVSAKANDGHYFAGWDYSLWSAFASKSGASGVGIYDSTNNAWKTSTSIDSWAPPTYPKYSDFEWYANFFPVSDLFNIHESATRVKPEFGEVLEDYEYDGEPVGVEVFTHYDNDETNAKIPWYIEVIYSGQYRNGTSYTDSSTAPRFAGTYKAKVSVYNKESGDGKALLGYTEFSFTILPLDLYLTATVADKDYDGNSDATFTGWVYDSSNTNSVISVAKTKDNLDQKFKTIDGATIKFNFESENVKWKDDTYASEYIAHEIEMCYTGTETDKTTIKNYLKSVAEIDETKANIHLIYSYIIYSSCNNDVGDDATTAKIKPLTLSISINEDAYEHYKLTSKFYLNNTEYNYDASNGTIYYTNSNGEKVVCEGSFYGKMYDGNTSFSFKGITLHGLLAIDENKGLTFNDKNTTLTSKGNGSYTLVGNSPEDYIPANYYGGTIPHGVSSNVIDNNKLNVDALKSVQSDAIYLTDTVINNYTLSITDVSKKTNGFQVSIKQFLITQRPIKILFSDSFTVNKTYDGSTGAGKPTGDNITWMKQDANNGIYEILSQDRSKISVYFTDATLSFDSPDANYNSKIGQIDNREKTVILQGFYITGINKEDITYTYYYLANEKNAEEKYYIQDTDTAASKYLIKTSEVSATVSASGKTYDGTKTLVSNLTYDEPPTGHTEYSVNKNSPLFPQADAGTYNITFTIILTDNYKNHHLKGDDDFDGIIEQVLSLTISKRALLDVSSYSLIEEDSTLKDEFENNKDDGLFGAYYYRDQSYAPKPKLTFGNETLSGNHGDGGTHYNYTYYKGTETQGDGIAPSQIVNAGTYSVCVTAEDATNYTGSITMQFAIKPSPITIKAPDGDIITRVYGQEYYKAITIGNAIKYTSDEFTTIKVYNTYKDSLTIPGTWYYHYGKLEDSPNENKLLPVGNNKTFTIKFFINDAFAVGDKSNYDIAEEDGYTLEISVKITPASIIIVANNQEMTYGEDPNTKFINTKVSYVGDIVGGEDISSFGTVACEIVNKGYPSKASDINVSNINNYVMARDYDIVFVKDTTNNVSTNYNITWRPGTFTVNKRDVTFTASSAGKKYGDDEPDIKNSFSTENMSAEDTGNVQLFLYGYLERNAGEYVGPYDYTAETIRPNTDGVQDLLATDESKVKYFNLINYNFTTFALTTDSKGNRISFNITKKLISIEIKENQESVYGDEISISQSNYVVKGLVSGDSFSAIFPTLYIERTNSNGSVVTATNAGTYYLYVYEKVDELTKNMLTVDIDNPREDLADNYNIYFKIPEKNEDKKKYNITQREVIVTPISQTKTYGYADPELTYTIENYVSGEALLGSFQREVGEKVGSYVIKQGTFCMDANAPKNYKVIFNNPDDSIKLTITKLEVVITPVEGFTLETDENGTTRKVSLNRVTYDEDIASLQLAISEKVNMLTGYFKVEHEEITNKANGAILSDNDELRALITRYDGGIELPNFSSINSVGAYEMALNSNITNVDEGSALANYTFVYKSLGLEIVISGSTKTGSFLVEPYTAKIIPIKPQNITYGEQPDVATFTYKAVDPNGTNKINESYISGTLGLNRQGYDGLLPVGNYAITIGTLSSENYAISLDDTPVYLTVDKKEVLVTLSDSLIKVEYGEEEPVIAHKDSAKSSYTFSLTGLVDESDNASYHYSNGQIALSRTEANVSAVDTYSITIGNLNTANPNYNCVLDGEYKLQITQRNLLVVPDAGYTAIYGSGEYTLGTLTQQPTFKLFYKDDAQKPALIGSDEIGGTLKPIFVDEEGNHLSSLEAGVGKYAYDKPDNYTGDNANYALTFYSDFANSIVADFDLTALFGATSYTEDQQKIVDAFGAYGVDITTVYLEITPREIEVKFASSLSFNFGEEVTTENANVVYDAMNNDVLSLVYTLPSGLTVDGYPYPVYLPEEYDVSIDVTESNKLNPNYIISFIENDYNFFEVNKIEITLKPVDGQGKVYLESNPAEYLFTTTGSYAEGFEPKDGDIALARDEGETPGDYSYYFIINEESEIFSGVYLYDCYDFITNESGYAFHISKAQASIKIGEETIAVEDGKSLEIEYVYKNGAHTLTPALLLGGKDINGNDIATLRVDYLGLEQGIVENGTINVTAVGTYNFYIGIMASDLEMFNGCFITTYANLTIKVVPYSLGTLNPVDFGLTLQKIYGEEDPSFHFEITSELGDKLKGELVREEGENAGTYLMTPGKVTNEDGSECDDYTFSVLNCYFEIAKRDITIAPSEKLVNATKVYGDAELPIYEEIVAPVTNEALVATFTREAGENVGSYDITSVEINSTNYVVALDAESSKDVFTITKKKATVTANGITKTFNAEKVENSSLSYKVEGVLEGEELNGSLYIEGGEPTVVGTYNVAQEGFVYNGEGTDLNPNYDVAYVSAYVVITQAEVIVLPNSETYEYGDVIAPFTYTIKGTVYDGYPVVVVFNPLTDTGRGVHNITVNRAEMTALNPNYLISVANATVTITVRRITITSSASVTQVYGDEITEIPYEITSGSLLGEDKLSGALAPNDYVVGIHGVNQGTLSNPNYEITFELDGASYEITKRTVEVTAIATGSVYGDELATLEYTEVGLVNGDTLSGELYVNVLNMVGDYDIEVGTLAHPYYNVTFTKATYTVTAREITLTIRDAESQYGEELSELSYYLSKGSILEGDELNVVLTKNGGTQMGQYEITGSYNNDNYSVTFVNGTYTIHKYQATITVETKYISFIEDGDARSIVASCDSGAEITFIVKGEEVTNYFREAGKYVVELSAEETDNYYAPEKVTVYVTINRPVLSAEANGIDVTLTTENGFDPNLTVEMEKLPVDYMDMVAELTSKQKIVRAFTLTSIDESGIMEEVSGKTTVRIKVPTALAEQSEVQVMVRENGTYNIINVDNVDGYVTLEVEALSSFAFIMEETTNYLLLILVGVGALIILGSVMVFLFRKRA